MNGLLVVDKPGGMTSHDVVGKLRRISGEKSIGHLGTLDPMATGVLPLLLGKYTRLAQYFSSAEKTYTGRIRFGFATDTYDAEGQPAAPDCFEAVSESLTLEKIRAAAARFHGEMQQMPPPYSAKKIAGTPAYKLAREGKPVELKTARVVIATFDITGLDDAEAAFEISVSAGGYVRSVAHELGQDLGCGAHLSALRRTRAGAFSLADAHTFAELEALAGEDFDQCCAGELRQVGLRAIAETAEGVSIAGDGGHLRQQVARVDAQRFKRIGVAGQRFELGERVRIGQREGTGARSPQSAQVRAAAQILTEFVGHRAHVSAGADADFKCSLGVVESGDVEARNDHARGLQFHRLAFAGELVGRGSGNLFGGVGRRHLLHLAVVAGGGRADLFQCE